MSVYLRRNVYENVQNLCYHIRLYMFMMYGSWHFRRKVSCDDPNIGSLDKDPDTVIDKATEQGGRDFDENDKEVRNLELLNKFSGDVDVQFLVTPPADKSASPSELCSDLYTTEFPSDIQTCASILCTKANGKEQESTEIRLTSVSQHSTQAENRTLWNVIDKAGLECNGKKVEISNNKFIEEESGRAATTFSCKEIDDTMAAPMSDIHLQWFSEGRPSWLGTILNLLVHSAAIEGHVSTVRSHFILNTQFAAYREAQNLVKHTGLHSNIKSTSSEKSLIEKAACILQSAMCEVTEFLKGGDINEEEEKEREVVENSLVKLLKSHKSLEQELQHSCTLQFLCQGCGFKLNNR